MPGQNFGGVVEAELCEVCGSIRDPQRFVQVETVLDGQNELKVYLWPCRCLPEREFRPGERRVDLSELGLALFHHALGGGQ